jgi:hypothetical protein
MARERTVSYGILQLKVLRFAPQIAVVLILAAVVPMLPTYVQSLATKILIFAIFAMSLDLLMGYAGIMSLGHAAFFGLGGYAAGLLAVRLGIDNLWLGLLCGALLAMLVSYYLRPRSASLQPCVEMARRNGGRLRVIWYPSSDDRLRPFRMEHHLLLSFCLDSLRHLFLSPAQAREIPLRKEPAGHP